MDFSKPGYPSVCSENFNERNEREDRNDRRDDDEGYDDGSSVSFTSSLTTPRPILEKMVGKMSKVQEKEKEEKEKEVKALENLLLKNNRVYFKRSERNK